MAMELLFLIIAMTIHLKRDSVFDPSRFDNFAVLTHVPRSLCVTIA